MISNPNPYPNSDWNIGYCPQHDILQAELTVHETLTLFAGIKGVPSGRAAIEVEYWLGALRP